MIDKGLVVAVDLMLDEGTSPLYKDQPLAQHWARVAKLVEESGEAIAELILATGQNPRKGTDISAYDRLLAELADAAMTGVYAIQHFTKDIDVTAGIMQSAQRKHQERLLSVNQLVNGYCASVRDVVSGHLAG
jgi:hypothetical protein